jgi:hypothetical protein
MTSRNTLLLTFFSLFMAFQVSFAQEEECAFTLEKAEKLFEEGIIKEIPALLSPCLEKGFSKEEKLQAYKLIVLAYLFDDNKMEAEKTMRNFLKKYPEYKVLPTDPVEFVYLFESYNVFPIFTIGVFGGLNYAYVNVKEQYGTHNLNNNSLEYYPSGPGLLGGIRITRYITDEIDLNLELTIEQLKYGSVDSIYSFYELNVDEWQTRFSIPISGTYTFQNVKYVQPYVRLGLAPSFLLSANANAVGKYRDGSQENITGPDFSTKEQRNAFGLWGLIGGGVKYKIPRGYLILDARYNIGFSKINSNPGVDPESFLTWDYFYSDNDLKLYQLYFSIGYSYTLYKPVNKKK